MMDVISVTSDTESPGSRNGGIKARRDSACSQTAKKREMDRLAQKKSREKARHRVMELEKKLETLQSDDKQKQITDLLKVVDNLKKENERLRGVTGRIRGLVGGIAVPTGSAAGDLEGRQERPKSSNTLEENQKPLIRDDVEKQPYWRAIDGRKRSPGLHALGNKTTQCHTNVELLTPTPSGTSLRHILNSPLSGINDFDTALLLGTPGHYAFNKSNVVPDIDKWHISNRALDFGITTARKSFPESSVINSQASYKAILNRCSIEEESEREHPLWIALREVDEKIYGHKSKSLRVAVMLGCLRMILYRCNPCKETLDRVPTFLRPRPSQETIQHPTVVDFLFWPGLRDRLVFSYKRYISTGDFSAAFVKNCHFHWPFSDDEILVFDPTLQKHRISPLFEEFAFDLKNWTMDEEFFDKFAEMRHDMPVSNCRYPLGAAMFDCMPMTA